MRFSGENEMAITLAWDNKFEVGHERIDSEHRIFLSLIRDLSGEAESKAGKPRVERTLNEIYKYADFHFTSEENIMADIGYPRLDEHKNTHQRLLAQFKNKRHEYQAEVLEADAIVSFLFQWFALHTTQDDRRIAEYIAIPATET